MGLDHLGGAAVYLGAGFLIACSSRSVSSAQDASAAGDAGQPDGASRGEAGSRDASGADSAPSSDGSAAEASLASCPPLPIDAALPPDASCPSPDDTDHDGVPDCLDGCPYDPTKIAPGFCGCNTPDIDSDGDGVPDCIDLCPQDPNNTASGQCGCVGDPTLQPSGTPCTDSACPQAAATCNAVGVCGDRSVCSPCPGGRYVTSDEGGRYWLCGVTFPPERGPGCVDEDGDGGPGTARMSAQSACAAKGLTLLRVASSDENEFVTQFLVAPVWIGANDLQTPGEWYWSSATSNSDALFWSGAADGSPDNSLFSDWAMGAPVSNSCATIEPNGGRWSDTDCTQTFGYVCE
jgi:hypothetical protein